MKNDKTKKIFRIIFLTLIGVNFYHAFIGDLIPRSRVTGWADFRPGPFLTIAFAWLILELIDYLSKNQGHHLSKYLWGSALFGLTLDSTGTYALLFDKISSYDKILHFLAGGMIIGFLAIKFIENISAKLQISRLLKYGLSLLLVNFVGVLYEIFESIADKFFGARNITSLFDTAEDLALNIGGAVFIILIHYFLSKKSSAPPNNS